MSEQNLLESLRLNRAAIIPRLERWKAEISVNPTQAGANPTYTLGKLLGYVGDICNLPGTYTIDEWKGNDGYYCRVNLPGNCSFVNQRPASDAIEAMTRATADAIVAILRTSFNTSGNDDDSSVNPTTVGKPAAQNGINIADPSSIKLSTDTSTSTSGNDITGLLSDFSHIDKVADNRNTGDGVGLPAGSKLQARQQLILSGDSGVVSTDEAIAPGKREKRYVVDLREYSLRGFFAALVMQMGWKADFQVSRDQDVVQARLMVEDLAGHHVPWLVSETGASDKTAREAAIRRFLEVLNREGIIRPHDNIEHSRWRQT